MNTSLFGYLSTGKTSNRMFLLRAIKAKQTKAFEQAKGKINGR